MWFFVQLCSSWQDFNWLKASCGPSAIAKLLVTMKHIISEEFRYGTYCQKISLWQLCFTCVHFVVLWELQAIFCNLRPLDLGIGICLRMVKHVTVICDHITISMLLGNTAYCVKLYKDLSHYLKKKLNDQLVSEKVLSSLCDTILLWKWRHNNKHLSEVCPHIVCEKQLA